MKGAKAIAKVYGGHNVIKTISYISQCIEV